MDAADKYQDAYQTWAMQIARNVSAEGMVEAVSGYGVEVDTPAIQPVLDATLGFGGGSWDYSSWVPDAVLILIGPNDEIVLSSANASRSEHEVGAGVGNAKFIKQYLQLLTMVATNYKHAATPPKIVHICGGSLNGLEPCDDIQTAVKQFNLLGLGLKSYYTTITTEHWDTINGCKGESGKHCSGKSEYNGCDGHYNVKGHGVLAADIIPQFKAVMGWS